MISILGWILGWYQEINLLQLRRYIDFTIVIYKGRVNHEKGEDWIEFGDLVHYVLDRNHEKGVIYLN